MLGEMIRQNPEQDKRLLPGSIDFDFFSFLESNGVETTVESERYMDHIGTEKRGYCKCPICGENASINQIGPVHIFSCENCESNADDITDKEAVMPDVRGLSLGIATTNMVEAGVNYYDIVWQEDAEHPHEVLSQSVAPGEVVDTSIPVTIVVSSSNIPEEEIKNTITVGSYLGCTIDEAITRIIDDNLSIGGILEDKTGEKTNKFELGMISGQSPEAGTEVDPQTEVTLYYRGE